jgi:hypothetical protein
MFAKLAMILAVGRARRPVAVPLDREAVRRTAPHPRRRTAMRCHWLVDEATNRPVCAWQTEDKDPQSPRVRGFLRLVASRGTLVGLAPG